MKIKVNLRKILPGVSTIAVLIALIVIAFFQYRWVVSSAETDIPELYKSLVFSIDSGLLHQSESQPLIKKNSKLLIDLNDDDQLKAVVKLKSELIEIYGSDSIISISKLIMDKNTIYSELYNNEWEYDLPTPHNLSREVRSVNRPDIHEVTIIEDRLSSGEIWILFPINKKSRAFIIYKINLKIYYSRRVEKISNNILSNYEVKVYDKLPENIKIINEEEYTYSPLSTIKSILLNNRQRWVSSIPFHLMTFPIGPENNKPEQRRPPSNLRNIHPSMTYIDILDDGKSLIITKENYLTLQWLLILLLIIGIGIAYILILSQISKLKQLRLKEKEFIATISHELRTPLTVIQAASDNIKSGILKKDRMIQYGQLITDQSIRLSSMIEGILLFSRLEGKAEKPPQLEEVALCDIKQSLEIFSRSLMDRSKNIIDIEFDSLPLKTITHRETIELILTNLISNSNKHAYKDDVSGRISVVGKISSGNSLIFKVSDNGAGIDSSEKKDIFDPFFRGKRSLKYQIKGTGLGLYLSKRKANLIGGTLKVDNNVDKGVVFTLKIPLTQANMETHK